MKTKATIILLLLNVAGYSQSYPTINIWDVEKDTINVGDSFYVGFKFLPPAVSPFNTTCGFQLWSASLGDIPFLWQGNYNDFYAMPKYTQYPWATNDSVSKITLTIPSNFPGGVARIYSTNGTPQYKEVFIRSTVGIAEMLRTKEVKEITYLNLAGQEIPKETTGLKIKKVTFTDNSIGYQKEFGLN